MRMENIEKSHLINSNNLSGEFYFTSLIQEAYDKGLLKDYEIENIQLQCIKLLTDKSESYNDGKSSSIRVETAESIMKSNLYTIGLYLKSLKDTDWAVSELKTSMISKMYEKGRKLINIKLNTAKHIYRLVQRNKLNTINYTYNATLDKNGIGSFFHLYNPDYEAHETPGSVDYQLCNPVTDLTGVEYIQKYLENLLLENEFCRNFAWEDIHHLLCGYDSGYKDLLINIFEQVLTAALGCMLAKGDIKKLDISVEEVRRLNNELLKDDEHLLALKIKRAAEKMIGELNIDKPSLRSCIEKSLPKIKMNIVCAVKASTLGKTFVSPVNPDLKPKIRFFSGVKMEDKEYRKFIEELEACRYSSDKLAFIKEKVKSFGDMEDLMFDAKLSRKETCQVLDLLGDVEVAAILKRHPPKSHIQTVDLSEAEQTFRLYLKGYIDELAADRKKGILEIAGQLLYE